MKALNQLDRGWQKIIDFTIGDNVKFDVPYLDSKFTYIGTVLEIHSDYALVEYYQPQSDMNLKTHVSLVDSNGYKRIKKIN